jgi:hypothetical protein
MGAYTMREKKEFTISDEDFSIEIDELDVNLKSVCTTPTGSVYEYILDYKAKNEAKARQMFNLLNEGEVYIDGGIRPEAVNTDHHTHEQIDGMDENGDLP